jgi:hypothetical protein
MKEEVSEKFGYARGTHRRMPRHRLMVWWVSQPSYFTFLEKVAEPLKNAFEKVRKKIRFLPPAKF